MKKELLNLKFNMNKQMTDYMIEIIKIKESLDKMNQFDKDYKIKKERFEYLKKQFIKEFQSINQDEIDEYYRIKDET